MHIEVKTSQQLEQFLPKLAQLRIKVFKEFPYLYDGTEQYEAKYLQTYIQSGRAVVVLVFYGDHIVGASTGVPMEDETEEFKKPFFNKGFDPHTLFYCGESILLPEYRGKGIYKDFFRLRESHAQTIGGITHCCFCAVVRPVDHPLKPKNYQPLDKVWQHFGYRPRKDLLTQYRWKDIDQKMESEHTMKFWLKELQENV